MTLNLLMGIMRMLRWTSGLIMFLLLIGSTSGVLGNAPTPVFAYQGVNNTACKNPANPIVAENCQSGTDEWMVRNYTPDIELYSSKDSVNAGESLDFFVDTTAQTFDLYIYRNGYYGGLGGRLVYSMTGVQGVNQADCARAEDTGLRTCSNWKSSYTLPIPNDWVSGVYITRVQRPDTGGENDTVFVVRQDERHSEILYQQSVSTFQAYNNFGGKSVYNTASSVCPTVADARHAVKVSFNRPYIQPNSDPNHYYRVEYPMVRWLEEQGYDVTYSTSMDTHQSGKPGAQNHLLDHKIFLSVGHDEYVSQEMRDAITTARGAGVSIGFFTANTGYWRIRFEPDPLSNETDSIMVVYKSTESGPADPSGYATGTWRDPQGANNPENDLNGVMYIGDNDSFFFPLRVSAAEAKDPLFRHTGLQNMPPNTHIDIGQEIVGWEWDAVVDNGHTPAGLTVVATSPTYGELLQDAGDYLNNNLGEAKAQTTYYIAPSGAMVFASGTIQWSWGLGAHGLNIVKTDPYIAQLTHNVLADMGAQPATPADTLIVDGSNTPDPALPQDAIKTDHAAPIPVIANIQVVPSGSSATVSWDTDSETTGQLWYGERSGYIFLNTTPDLNASKQHSFTITNLEPRKTYFFKVVSVNHDWGVAISDENQFQTGSLAFTGEISHALSPLVQTGGCWIRANTTFAIVLGCGVLFALLAAGWRVTRLLRRPAKPATQTA